MNEQLKWFEARHSFIKMESVERSISMPKTTLNQWLKGNRELPKKWVEPLTAWIIAFRN